MPGTVFALHQEHYSTPNMLVKNPSSIFYLLKSYLADIMRIEIQPFPSSKYLYIVYPDRESPVLHILKTIPSYESFAKPGYHVLAGINLDTHQSSQAGSFHPCMDTSERFPVRSVKKHVLKWPIRG